MSQSKSTADKIIQFPDNGGEIHVYDMGDSGTVCSCTFNPGWKWSTHLKPLLPNSPSSCQMRHVGICTEGCVKILMDDGTWFDINKGDAFSIAPGHDAYCEATTKLVDYHKSISDIP